MIGDAWSNDNLGLELFVHPMHILDADDFVLLDLWLRCRAGEFGGTAVLPFAGGAADQPSCVMASFDIMDAAAARLTQKRI